MIGFIMVISAMSMIACALEGEYAGAIACGVVFVATIILAIFNREE